MSERSPKKNKQAWPTKDVMEQIYEKNLWGGQKVDYYSGAGSHHPELLDPYVDVVQDFLGSFKPPLVVCDLGCGDFNVGRLLLPHVKGYVAVDIVKDLIVRNQNTFNDDKLTFQCLDIAKDDLPGGDCAILRNVLQHISNAEIQAVLNKLCKYDYLLLTEHLPEGNFIPNKEIISGQGIRLKKNSGVCLTAPPFNLQIRDEKELLSVPYAGGKGRVVTTLYRL